MVSKEVMETINTTTKDTNQVARKLSDDVLHAWRNIKENRERLAVIENKTKDLPDMMKDFYHIKKILIEGNGNESISKVVSDLSKAGLISRMKKVEEDTAKNTALNNKIMVIACIMGMFGKTIMDKIF